MAGAAPAGPAGGLLVGLPLAAATLAILTGWIRGGRLVGWLPVVGVAVLLVDLLAAGGIGFPGVAGTLWLLLAIGLFGQPVRQWRGWVAWGGLAVAILLAGACYLTAYRPVLGCQAELQMAEREPERAIEHLAAAAAADRFSPEPWQRLAAIELGDWIPRAGSDSFNRFESAMTHANRLAPNSASSWLAAGDAYSQAASALDGRRQSLRSEVLGKAVAADRRAVSLYPNSGQYRAKLAEALLAVGDMAAFRREARTALELDRETPHLDKKLPDDVRNRLTRSLGPGPSF